MSASPYLWVLVGLSLEGGGLGQQPAPEVSYLQVQGRRILDAVAADVDGDGRLDLVLATAVAAAEGAPQRRLDVHLQREGQPRFVPAADRSLPVVRDVVAFTVADVHAERGREIVLLSPSIAVGLRWPSEAAEPRPFRIAPIRLLWQPADPGRLFALERGVADLDGDGLEDLVLPEPGGYRVLLQRRAEGEPQFEAHAIEIKAPPASTRELGEERLRRAREDIDVGLREQDRQRLDSLIALRDVLPAPFLLDWAGKGRADVLAIAEGQLCVFAGERRFAPQALLAYALPDPAALLLHPSSSLQVSDVDGDGRLDAVAVSSQVQGDDVRSYVDVHLQRPDGTLDSRPDDRLMLQGFVDVPRLHDVDGDGRPELTIGSLRPDLIGTLSAGGSGSIEGQISVFRNAWKAGQGRFARPVAMAERVPLPADILRSRVRSRLLAEFLTDLDGDGLADFLDRTSDTRVAIRRTVRHGERWQLGAPLFELGVTAGAQVVPWRDGRRGRLLVLEDAQVVYVELP